MNVLDFLRDVGKNLTVNYMMSKDSVKNRLESGLSFTEFSYQLLQGYDFLCLYRENGVRLQMGGSDQWGNITSGTEMIRRNVEGGKAFAVTTPLLTKADGTKFGKSESGNVWLDGSMTSPYKFYQFWINADDRDLPKFIRYFTLKSKEEVEALEKEHADNPRALKKILAEELTIRVHSQEDYEAVLNVSEILFNKKASKEQLMSLNETAFAAIKEEIPAFEISENKFDNGISIIDLLADATNIVASNGDARRAIKGNAISVNKEKVLTRCELLEWIMEYKLDRSAFRKRPIEDQGHDRSYWLSKTPRERICAAFYFSLRAHGLDPHSYPRMDKSYFLIRNQDSGQLKIIFG